MENFKTFKDIYKEKLIDVKDIKKIIKSGQHISFPMHFMQPPRILQEVAAIARADKDFKIKAFYFSAKKNVQDSILQYDLNKQIEPHTFFVQPTEREIFKKQAELGDTEKRVFFHPCHFSQAPRVFSENLEIDTFVCMVSKMNEFGYMSLGLANDYTSTALKRAKHVILEVNENVPFVIGEGNLVHVSDVDAIIEHNSDLLEIPDPEISKEDEVIAETIANMVEDGSVIQMGVGALPNLVCTKLYNKKDLGIHTEVLTVGMIDLIKRGVVTNKTKNINKGVSIFTFAVGNKNTYKHLHLNPSLQSYPVNYVNDELNIAKNDKVISINSTIEIDLTGACNSEWAKGQQFSATGGQVDFVRGAYRSKGGKSFIALKSTTKNGTISKIVPKLNGPTTTLRNDVHWVVTEFGAVNLKGLSDAERAEALISLAHPKFRDELRAKAKELKLL